jgi:hypothetical protein
MSGTERTDAEILTVALESLNYGGACIFFACPGPDEPFVNMATCCVCAAVQDLRLLAARIGAQVPESVWS